MSNAAIKETVENLRHCAIDIKPRDIDWREALGEDCEGWESFEALDCDECDRVAVVSSRMGEDEHRYIEPEITVTDEDGDEDEIENECMGHLYHEGPMMNYWYPVRIDDAHEAARAVARYPVCVVVFEDGETGLALTGGGMDLSWEICGAFIALGYLPPVHFCDLPDMAGRHNYTDSQLILAACRRSCEVAEGWARRKADRLTRMQEDFANKSRD